VAQGKIAVPMIAGAARMLGCVGIVLADTEPPVRHPPRLTPPAPGDWFQARRPAGWHFYRVVGLGRDAGELLHARLPVGCLR